MLCAWKILYKKGWTLTKHAQPRTEVSLTIPLGNRIGMNRSREDANWLSGPVLGIHRNLFNGIQSRVHTVNDLCKDGVFRVQMWLLVVCDKELRSVCIWSGVGH